MSRRLRSTTTLFAVSLAIPILALVLAACGSDSSGTASSADPTAQAAQPVPAGAKTIYIAGGCFWGLEKYIGLVKGSWSPPRSATPTAPRPRPPTVTAAATRRPSRSSTTRRSPRCRSCSSLFYDAIEPTSVNRQGNDYGTEYRTGIYYTDPADKAVIARSLGATAEGATRTPSRSRAARSSDYTAAEDYHQDYLEKNPGGYCHIPRKLFDAARAARPK